jgi:hypothetical protein
MSTLALWKCCDRHLFCECFSWDRTPLVIHRVEFYVCLTPSHPREADDTP